MNNLLRVELEEALAAEIERVGPAAFKVEPVVKAFEGRGVSKPSLYRWAAAYRASGRPGVHLTAKVRESAAERAERVSDPSRDAAEEIVAALPTVIRPDDIAGAGGFISVIGRLQASLELADQIIRQAKNPDGTVRLTKTALAASEHIRKCLETSVRMADAMRDVANTDAFHLALVDEVAKEAPELAERLRVRLHHLTGTWNFCA